MDESANDATFGGRLAAARRAAGLTQEQLGKGLGPDGADVGKGGISSWEVGRTEPSPRQVALICDRLRVSADYLVRGLRSSRASNEVSRARA